MTGHDFVNGVERSPHAYSVTQAIEQFFRECAEIPVFMFCLALGQFSDHEVAIVLEFLFAGTGESQRASREVVPAGKVAA